MAQREARRDHKSTAQGGTLGRRGGTRRRLLRAPKATHGAASALNRVATARAGLSTHLVCTPPVPRTGGA